MRIHEILLLSLWHFHDIFRLLEITDIGAVECKWNESCNFSMNVFSGEPEMDWFDDADGPIIRWKRIII